MQIIRNIDLIKEKIKQTSRTVGFVPTMGALHLGHISLIQKAREQNDIVVVSIFVNPMQFGENEDLSTYPKKEKADIEASKRAGCDILFLPSKEDIYNNNDDIKIKSPNTRGHILEGFSRPTHFDGVMHILTKFFNIINPTKAYFGKKDAQQLILVKQLVQDLFFDIDIVECETIREKDGLALSSRNVYLNEKTRKKALNISKSLSIAYTKIQQGHLKRDYLINAMKSILEDIEIDYIETIDRNMKQIDSIEIRNSIILIAVIIDNKRYIDNLWV